MKRLTLLMVMLFISLTCIMAQNIGEYTYATSTTGSLIDMSSATTSLLTAATYHDDVASAVTDIGFNFKFAGTWYTQFSANSNGQMQLGSTAISGGAASPATGIARFAPISGDNAIRATGTLHYKVTGSSPNRILVVEWKDLRIPYNSAAETGTYCTMQALLYEGTYKVEFIYGTMYNMATTASSRGVYIANSNVAGTVGNITTITTTPTWTNTGTSVVTTSFPLSSAMANLSSAADGERRVFSFTPPAATALPNAAVALTPANGDWALLGSSLSWNDGSTASGAFVDSYDVYFGLSASPAFVQNQVSRTYTPTLAPSTTYYWKVVPKNNLGDCPSVPTWSFTTPATAQLAESFESTTFPPAGWTNPGTWSRSTLYARSGVASASRFGSTSLQYILSGPKVTITSSSVLDFYYAGSSLTAAKLQVVYSPDRSTWTQLGSEIVPTVINTFARHQVDLSSLAGQNLFIGFRTGLGAATSYVDLVVGPEITAEAPGPVTLSLPADAATSVNERPAFSWAAPTTGGIPTGYKIYCDTNSNPTTLIGTVTGSGTLTFTPTTALAYSTLYYWTVVATNGTGDSTAPAPRSFTTRPDPVVSTFPTVWDFGTLSTDPFPPTNWTKHSGVLASPTVLGAAGTGSWVQDDWRNITAPANKAARINIYSTLNGWLISPAIAVPGNNYELRFDVAYMAYGNNNAPATTGTDDQFIVLIGDGTSWTPANIVRQWDNAGSPYVLNNIPPAGMSVSLPLGSAGTKYIAFYGISTVANADNDLMVDNIEVRQIPEVAIFNYSPSSINYPFVAENGTSEYSNVVVTNVGGATLNLAAGDISLIGEHADQFGFTTAGLPAALTAGQSVNIPVRFQPDREGAKTATLRISYAGTNYDVALSGYAYGPSNLYESFEATAFPPAGWANPGTWSRSTSFFTQGIASAYKFTSTSESILSTPMLTMNAESVVMFKARTSSTNADQRIQVKYSTDRTTWTNIGAPIALASNAAFATFSVDLSALAGNNYYIGLAAYAVSTTGSIYVDELIAPAVTPLAPGTATLVAPLDAAVNQLRRPTLSWNAPTLGGIPTGYKIYCDTNNPPTTLVTTVTASPYAFTSDLAWAQTYYWMVVPTNATGDATGNTVRSFTVMADPTIYVTPGTPYSMNFDGMGSTFPPTGWSRLDGLYGGTYTAGTYWVQDDWLNVTTPTNKSAKMNIYSTDRGGFLITPPVSIPSTGYELKFDAALLVWNGTTAPTTTQADDRFLVVMSDSPTMSNPTILREWNNTGSPFVYNNIPHTGANYTIELTGVSGTKYFAFYGESTITGNGDNDLMVDNVVLRQIPAGAPHNVTLTSPANQATGINPANVSLAWSPAVTGGTPTGYTILVGEYPIDPANSYYGDYEYETTGTTFNLSATDIVLGYNATWYWAVWPFNGDPREYADEFDPSFRVFSFTTIPDPRIVSLPYTQNFDGVTAPALPINWTAYTNSTVSPTSVYVRTTTTSPNTSPNSVGFYNAADTAANLMLIAPQALVNLNTIKMTFWARWSSYSSSLQVGTVSDPANPASFTAFQTVPLTSTLTQYTVNWSAYAGTDQYIAFKSVTPTTYSYIYFDSMNLSALVDYDLMATAITGLPYGFVGTPVTHSVTVVNNGTQTVNSYNVHLKRIGDDRYASLPVNTPLAPGASAVHEITWTPTSVTSFDIQGEVEYTGDMVPANNFTPTNLGFGVYPQGALVEGFEGGVMPEGWTVRSADGGVYNWEVLASVPRTGTYSARVRWESTSLQNDDWLITPPLQLSSSIMDQISFWMARTSTSWPEPFEIRLSTTTNEIAAFTVLLEAGDMNAVPINTYIQKTYNLDAYGDAVVYIAVRYIGLDDYYLHVDDFVGPPIYNPIVVIDAPVVTIETSGANVVLNWAAVPNATLYKVYASNDPYTGFTLLGTTANLSYTITAPAAAAKFYQVTATNEAPAAAKRRAPSAEEQRRLDAQEALLKQ